MKDLTYKPCVDDVLERFRSFYERGAPDRFFAAFDILPQVKERVGGLPLILSVEYGKFKEALNHHELSGGVFYVISGIDEVDVANECMEKIRSYLVK